MPTVDHHRDADAVEDIFEHDRRDGRRGRNVRRLRIAFVLSLTTGPRGLTLPRASAATNATNASSKAEALALFDAERPGFCPHRHSNSRTAPEQATNPETDASNAVEDSRGAGRLQRVGEEHGPRERAPTMAKRLPLTEGLASGASIMKALGVLNIGSDRVKVRQWVFVSLRSSRSCSWQLCGDMSGQARSARRGVVRGDGHAFVDDGGPFLARGATLFWALWGYQHDRARLGRNLETLRNWGFDYIRVLGVVGEPGDRPGPVCGPGVANCDSWRDRRLDPTAPDYARDIAGFTDWAYREYGLRVQWTIFGGTGFTPTAGSRRAIVDVFAGMAKGREQAIFAFEVANEASQNGFSGEEGRNELRGLARALKSSSSEPGGAFIAQWHDLRRRAGAATAIRWPI